jgi:hypothetical protein
MVIRSRAFLLQSLLVRRLLGSMAIAVAAAVSVPAPASPTPRQDGPIFNDLAPEVRIDLLRRQLSELRAVVILKQAEWDKLHGEYQRMLANSGGRMNRVGQAKVAKLDAEARGVKAEIELAETRIAELEELLEEAEEELAAPRRGRSGGRAQDPGSDQGADDGGQALPSEAEVPIDERGGGRRGSAVATPPSGAAISRGYPMIDVTDPVGAGGAGTAVYRVMLLTERFGDEVLRDTRSFTVHFDALGLHHRLERNNPGGVRSQVYAAEIGDGGRMEIEGDSEFTTRVIRGMQPSTFDDGSMSYPYRQYARDGTESNRYSWKTESAQSAPRLVSARSDDTHEWFMVSPFLQYPLLEMSDEFLQSAPRGHGDAVEFAYYSSGRIGRITIANSRTSFDRSTSIQYTYEERGRLRRVDLLEGGLDAIPRARFEFTKWDSAGRWVDAHLYTGPRGGDRRSQLVRAARIEREFDFMPRLDSFVQRELNLFPQRSGGGRTSVAEDPSQLGSASSGGFRGDSDSRPTGSSGSSVPAGAPSRSEAVADGSAPRVIEFERPSTAGPSALEQEGATAAIALVLGGLLAIGGGVLWLVVQGMACNIVIFESWSDFALSFFAAALTLGGSVGILLASSPGGTWTALAIAILAAVAGVAMGASSFALAFKHNGRGFLGVVVGIFKIVAGFLLVVAIFAKGSELMDRNARLRDRIESGILMLLFGWLAKALVNGDQVREKRAGMSAD